MIARNIRNSFLLSKVCIWVMFEVFSFQNEAQEGFEEDSDDSALERESEGLLKEPMNEHRDGKE